MIFDRSWYNRAGVEPVMGFCTWEESARFLELVPVVEQAIIDSGVILIKYWLEVSQEEQTRRLTARIDDGRKTWKLSQMDLDSYGRWYDYSRARDNMFAATDTETAPWYVANSDDKRRARLNIISHILDLVPYEREKRRIGGPAASPEEGRLPGAACASTRGADRGSDSVSETASSQAACPWPGGPGRRTRTLRDRRRSAISMFPSGTSMRRPCGWARKIIGVSSSMRLTVDTSECRARAGPDLELFATELEGMATARPLAGQGQGDDFGGLRPGCGGHREDAEATRIEPETLGCAGRRRQDVGVVRHHDEK